MPKVRGIGEAVAEIICGVDVGIIAMLNLEVESYGRDIAEATPVWRAKALSDMKY